MPVRKRKVTPRDQELSGNKERDKELLSIFEEVDEGFQAQWDRTNSILDYWDIYHCRLGSKQQYNGNAQGYLPIVHDALNARSTRFTNQMFPQSGRYVEVIAENGDIPHREIALAEHYCRRAQLRTQVAPALVLNGDIEGHYHVYVSWQKNRYYETTQVMRPPRVDGEEIKEAEAEIPDIQTAENYDAGPDVEVLADADVLILPVTARSVDDALAQGGSVTVLRRWTKDAIRQKADQGLITEDSAEILEESMTKVQDNPRTPTKVHADAAGIKTQQNGDRFALVYETWTMLKIDGQRKLCRAFYGGDEQILGCKRNPYWYDRCPVISAPRKKIAGIFKGMSAVQPVEMLQYQANDFANQAADSATYALLPIIMTDPEKNPRVGSMVLDLAAIWETSPKDTSFAQFPPLYQHAMQIISSITSDIFRTLGVNSAMIPQQTGVTLRRKMNQAEIAQEQQVDILSTADSVTVVEQGILDPLVTWFMWLDHQFRKEPITVRAFGQMGLAVQMEKVEPIQMGNAYTFRWFGVEAARNAQQVQQQVAFLNVLRGIPPQMYPGRTLDITPVIEQACENVFGPRLAPLVFQDVRQQLTVDPELENQMLQSGYDVPTHPMDDDQAHIAEHMKIAAEDPHRQGAAHILKHQQQIDRKAMAAAEAAMQIQGPPGMPGTPGGVNGMPPGPQGPGVAGAPRPGAQPAMPRAQFGPPGLIRPDNMPQAGAVGMPRRM